MENFEENHDLPELIAAFERNMQNKQPYFLDLQDFEEIILHYTEIGETQKALQAIAEALHLYPYSSELLLQKAELLADSAQYKEALQLVQQLEQVMPLQSDVYFLKESIFAALGNYQKAIEILEQMLPFYAEKDDIYYRIALNYQQLTQYKQALRFYQKALKINIEHTEANLDMIFCAELSGNLVEVVQFYKNYLDKEPYNAWVWDYLGFLYLKMQENSQALDALEYAIAINDQVALFYFHKGQAYMNMQMYQNALDAYHEVYTKVGTTNMPLPNVESLADLLCHIGACYEYLKNYNEAHRYYKKATEHKPLWQDAWVGMGSCHLKMQEWLKAIHYFKKAIKISDNQAEPWLGLAQAEAGLGNEVSAEEAFKQAALLDPTIPQLWLNWSLFYFNMQHYKQAINIILEGIDELPEVPLLYYHAVVYMIFGKKNKLALNYLEQALALDYEMHPIIYNFFKNVETQLTLYKVIEQFRKNA